MYERRRLLHCERRRQHLAEPRVRWVKFVDLSGSRVRLDTRQIEYLCQCTAEQRAMDREFSRALTRERKTDSALDEDE